MGADAYVLSCLSGLMRDHLRKVPRFCGQQPDLQPGAVPLRHRLRHGLALGAFPHSHPEASSDDGLPGCPTSVCSQGPLINLQEQVQDFQFAAGSIGRIQELFAIQPAVRELRPEGGRAVM